MADAVTIKVDASRALARFSPSSGIPVAVRNNLRQILPDITKRLGALVDSKLSAGLKTRRRLQVKKELVENPSAIYGRVRTISTAAPFFLPQILESGAVPHVIEARRAQALYFYWERLGMNVAFKRVNHPGFRGIHYSHDAFAEMESEIRSAIEQAVRQGARQI